MSVFKDKVLLITGGTGSFGNAVLRRSLNSDIREIRIFSRDEKKQDDMRHALQNPKVKFYIGNVRNAWGGLCVCCGGVEAGSELRVFSYGGHYDKCYRHGQCACVGDRAWC